MKQLTSMLGTAMCFTGLTFSDFRSDVHSLQSSGHGVNDRVSRAVVIDGGSRVLGWPDGTPAIQAYATAIDSCSRPESTNQVRARLQGRPTSPSNQPVQQAVAL